MDQYPGGQAAGSAPRQIAVQLKSPDELLAELLSGDEARAESAVEALVAVGEQALPRLLDLLRSHDSDQRWWAVRTLAAFDEPKVEWFISALNDSAAEVRSAGALALAAHPRSEAVAPLIRLLGDDDNVTAVMAVNALVKIGGEAVPQLLDAFDEAPRGGRVQIMRALCELRDPRAIRLMLNAQGQSSAALQYWAQEGLERLGLNMVYLRPE